MKMWLQAAQCCGKEIRARNWEGVAHSQPPSREATSAARMSGMASGAACRQWVLELDIAKTQAWGWEDVLQSSSSLHAK